MSDFDFEAFFLEPRPDEDAWEAFLNLAFERIGGERSSGLTIRQINELEAVIGYMLPFEVGLMLVMGVPLADGWHHWSNPEQEFAAWNDQVSQGICFDVEHNNVWFPDWGPQPEQLGDQLDIARDQFANTIPPLFPVYNDRAVPLPTAEGFESSDGNPVLVVAGAKADVYGTDVAAWMHKEFEVPLPMWPADERTFTFWSQP